MRRTHDVPLTVKAANLVLARYFPPWTVTREQWSISGVANDTLLFSRIGSPLLHRYQIISHTAALRGKYMRRLHAFLEEWNSAVVRRQHRRCAKELATLMSLSSGRDSADGMADVPSRSTVSHRSVSRARRPRKPKGGGGRFFQAVGIGLSRCPLYKP